jgi:alpha-beta hydrolase superfamily lysophospholipase
MLNDKRIYDNVSRDLPVYLFSGKKDPVGDFGKGVQQVTLQFQRDGFKNVTEKFYYDGRHEMLNETNRDEVYQDVLDWINLQLNN